MRSWPFAVSSRGVTCRRSLSDDFGPGTRMAGWVAAQQAKIQFTERILHAVLGVGKRYAKVHDV